MLKDMFAAWQRQSDLVKLQYAYAAVVIVTLVAAGLVGLLNQDVSRQILSVTWVAAVAFFVNLISFAIVNLFADVKPEQPVSRTQKRETRTNHRS